MAATLASHLLRGLRSSHNTRLFGSSFFYIVALISELPLDYRKAFIQACRFQCRPEENSRLQAIFDDLDDIENPITNEFLSIDHFSTIIGTLASYPITNSILLNLALTEQISDIGTQHHVVYTGVLKEFVASQLEDIPQLLNYISLISVDSGTLGPLSIGHPMTNNVIRNFEYLKRKLSSTFRRPLLPTFGKKSLASSTAENCFGL